MFIDNECAGLMAEEPLKSQLNYGAKIFSLSTRDKFDEYLDVILRSVSAAHLTKVREVYGDEWEKPFTAIYDSKSP